MPSRPNIRTRPRQGTRPRTETGTASKRGTRARAGYTGPGMARAGFRGGYPAQGGPCPSTWTGENFRLARDWVWSRLVWPGPGLSEKQGSISDKVRRVNAPVA
jgi:hypothetical protein